LILLAIRANENIIRKQGALFTPLSVVIREGNVNGADQVRLIKWLGEIIRGKGFLGAAYGLAVGVITQVDNRQRRSLHDLGGNGNAIEISLQLNVHQNQVGLALLKCGQGFFPRATFVRNLQTVLFQEGGDTFSNDNAVFNNQDVNALHYYMGMVNR